MGNVISFGELRLDSEGKQAWCGEKEIPLTAKEFALLEYFMRHPGVTLTRMMISDEVWGKRDAAAFTNLIDVYVNYLRRKLAQFTEKKLIHTVRGVGYLLKED